MGTSSNAASPKPQSQVTPKPGPASAYAARRRSPRSRGSSAPAVPAKSAATASTLRNLSSNSTSAHRERSDAESAREPDDSARLVVRHRIDLSVGLGIGARGADPRDHGRRARDVE